MSPNAVQRVLLVFAMETEAMPLVKRLGLQRDAADKILQPAPCVTFSGRACDMDVHVVWNGRCGTHGVDNVGTVPAALSTYIAAQAFKPHVIISAGTAGGFKSRGAAIGDVFVSDAVMHHDRRIPLPSFNQYGISYTKTLAVASMAATLGLKTGTVTSGNSLDYTDKDMEIMTQHSAAVKEMEAGAIAWVAQMFQVPLLCVKLPACCSISISISASNISSSPAAAAAAAVKIRIFKLRN
ncbi:nucleoside phosphorylase domain-containing protein [Dunaliella salina]|uniref:Nucleoside phosphorylase domain-containing protein n=1 Tax=Dunaliella salina TaxID=3046 RepID=A0ABQ7H1Y4_DUNSA|nr:nucleoside phosphorylase domain-containing protein [Dunaliella salina]|eukprot:KAF5840826.1 nucleoside phosphorylase domain-containing protein [Dunaliella salina]